MRLILRINIRLTYKGVILIINYNELLNVYGSRSSQNINYPQMKRHKHRVKEIIHQGS